MRIRVLIAVVALGFFWAPVALRLVGVTARPFENRPLATLPQPSQGWDALDQTTRFFVDRLPLREQAVQANTWISETVFATTPDYARNRPGGGDENAALPFGQPGGAAGAGAEAGSDARPGGEAAPAAAPPAAGQAAPAPPAGAQPAPTVLEGKRGWLYLGDELGRACTPFLPWPEAMRRWERLVSILRRSGRDVVLLVAPDKSTIYPEYLPDSYVEKDCLPAARRRAWAAVAASSGRDPRVIGLRGALAAAKRPPPDEIYLPKDTHWNTVGGTLAVRAALDRLPGGPNLRDGEIRKDRAPYTGDLTKLLGAAERGSSPHWVVRRPGQPKARTRKETLPGGHPAAVARRPAGGPDLLPGRTLFLYDSMGVAMLGALKPYARTLSLVQWYGTTSGIVRPSLIAALRRSRTIVIETVERDLNFKASDQGFVAPDFLDELAAALPAQR